MAVFFLLARLGGSLAATWFAAVSLFFYGWWNPRYVPLLLASIVFNYGMGYAIGRFQGRFRAKALLIAALAVNLSLLAVFKYTDFAIDSVNGVLDLGIPHADLILPLGISFFTFTQISFLVDVYLGKAREHNFIHYTLFVTFFPHLIAGPVLSQPDDAAVRPTRYLPAQFGQHRHRFVHVHDRPGEEGTVGRHLRRVCGAGVQRDPRRHHARVLRVLARGSRYSSTSIFPGIATWPSVCLDCSGSTF